VIWLGMVSLGEKFFKTSRFFDTWTEPTFAYPWWCVTTFILIYLKVCVCVCVCVYMYIHTRAALSLCGPCHCSLCRKFNVTECSAVAAALPVCCSWGPRVWVQCIAVNISFYSPYLMKELAVVSFSSQTCITHYIAVCDHMLFCERYWQLCQHAYAGLCVFPK
jgi:hypothetical protein